MSIFINIYNLKKKNLIYALKLINESLDFLSQAAKIWASPRNSVGKMYFTGRLISTRPGQVDESMHR